MTIVELVNKLQMTEYLSVCFCGHFFSIDSLPSEAKIILDMISNTYQNAVPNIHKYKNRAVLEKQDFFAVCHYQTVLKTIVRKL